MTYAPRVIDSHLRHLLNVAGAVLVEGVRACGKTETGEHHSQSMVRLDIDDAARELADIAPDRLLNGATPRLIDEWQLAPQLWNHVRRAVDQRRAPGQFILAGSATPSDDVTRHSGAGRILRLRMRPMSLFESNHSSGEVSLRLLFDENDNVAGTSTMTVEAIAQAICVGGWPGLQGLGAREAQTVLRSYLDDVARADLAEASEKRRDPARVRRLLAAYARHVATPAAVSTIINDTGEGSGAPLRPETVRDYIDTLERIMVVEEQPSWGPHLRSRDIVRGGSIRHLVDPSLAVAAMNASADRLMDDPNTLGLLFESLVIRDLRVFAQAVDGEVAHYRDSAGAEADAIIQLRDGRWIAMEVKLGQSRVEEAAASLTKLIKKIDTSRAGDPSARVIITGGEYAYTRPDGIHVVPLGCLGP